MNFSIILYIIGYVLRIEGILMLLPAGVGLFYGERQAYAFFICAAVSLAVGFLCSLKRPKNQVFYAKEGFVVVPAAWIIASLAGCAPFVINKDIPRFVDAFFETVSGFTTTGSSVLSNVEALAHCSLFWRSFTHWIGGMGILVFILAIMPLTGGATMHLMRAESPGPQVGKMVPKIRYTSIILYVIYTAMTLLQIVILLCGGMHWFDAVTLSFGSAGTGGFVVKNSGLASYSPFCQYVIAVFMIAFGLNFNVYYLAVRRHFRRALRVEEAWWYIAIVAFSTGAITLNMCHIFPTLEESFRQALFQVGSLITTTGYSTCDYNALFPAFSHHVLFMLMLIGACAGSTGGGIKVSRVMIMVKSVRDEISRIIHPRAVKKVRLEGKVVEHGVMRSVNTFMLGYLAVLCLSVILISLNNFDMTTNITSVVATLNNIGPGFGKVGPAGNFGAFSDFSKFVFCFDMLAGRLEILPVLVLLYPGTWRRAVQGGFSGKNKF